MRLYLACVWADGTHQTLIKEPASPDDLAALSAILTDQQNNPEAGEHVLAIPNVRLTPDGPARTRLIKARYITGMHLES
jgi:hypothetical protein